ncbi:tyrosine-type recombinase/integrase [Shewanella acanthi]|uniref:tyrosine-type recombinase/integrase n=1 Tax=Shewanella acanthi TaxID=2864212 RepID=UPI0021ACBD0A|nr:site-specific integrase [Shewanella acanthi]
MLMSVEEAKSFCKQRKLKYLEIRSNTSVRMIMKHKSKLYRMALDGIECTEQGLLQAADIVNELKMLAKYNPEQFLKRIGGQHFIHTNHKLDSPESMIESKLEVAKNQPLYVGHYIDSFLNAKRNKLAPCTLKNYQNKISTHIGPRFANVAIDTIKPSDIEAWMNTKLSYLSNKTIKEILSILNQIFTFAILDETLAINPLDKLKASKVTNLKVLLQEPDPFSAEEIAKFASMPTDRQSEVNMIVCNCFMGLRVSELMALAWEDIDFDNNAIYISRAVVEGIYKKPKNHSSNRQIELLPQAKAILLKQRDIAKSRSETVKVLREDNKSIESQTIHFVFINTQTNKAYTSDVHLRQRFYLTHLKNAQIRFRGPGQTRHTFASHLISAGLPLTWVARQMGHTSIKMIEKHYGKWLPTQKNSILDMAEKAFTF